MQGSNWSSTIIIVTENIDELYEFLSEELANENTSCERLDQIASDHIKHDFDCLLCEFFRENDAMISKLIARHNNCLEKTLDNLIGWGEGRGDPGWEVDILLSACSRSNLSGKWLDYVLDTAWVYRLQFENKLHFHFISKLMGSRELTEEDKSRIKTANDMDFNGQRFPTRQDLDRMGF